MDVMNTVFIIFLAMLGFTELFINNKYIKISGLIILAVVFSYICSIRPITSADTETYAFYYNEASHIGQLKYGFGRDYFPWIENWFINLCVLANKVGLTYRQFLFVIAFAFNIISSYSLYKIYKYRYSECGRMHYFAIVLTQFFVNYGFLYSYVVIRGGLSFAFCLLSYTLLLKEKKIPALLSLVVAVALHNYSVIFVLIMIVMKINFKKTHMKFFMIIFIILFVMNLFRIDVWFTSILTGISSLFTGNLLQVSHYLLDAEQTTSLKKGILLYLIQNIYLCIMYYKIEDPKITNDFFVLLGGSLLAVLINDNATIRITNYFFAFQIMLYGKYLSILKESIDDQNRFIISKDGFVHSVIILIFIPVITFIYMLRYCSII